MNASIYMFVQMHKTHENIQLYMYYMVSNTYIVQLFYLTFRSYSELLSKFGDISFQEYLSKGISHPVFYDDLV